MCWCLVRDAGVPGFVLWGRDIFGLVTSTRFTSGCFFYYSWSWKLCTSWMQNFPCPQHRQDWTSGWILPGILGLFIGVIFSMAWGNVSCASSKELLSHLGKLFRSPWTCPVWSPWWCSHLVFWTSPLFVRLLLENSALKQTPYLRPGVTIWKNRLIMKLASFPQRQKEGVKCNIHESSLQRETT